MSKALLVIDLQNDYFQEGRFPLWNDEGALKNCVSAIEMANSKKIPVIIIQHIANSSKGIAPFFNEGTTGADVHPRILEAAPDAPVVVKEYADSFLKTTLEETLARLGTTELLVCGMMTQNCVTHTAISKSAEKYVVTVLADCCTTVSEMIHLIALNALSTRVTLAASNDVL
ncbi:MAG: cysteine hydrolase [Geobacteraceae bacterium]|nr:cysteine hydrolase [Geobacteraceae bacterium]